MFVIDTNVASELMKPAPAPSVAAWIAARGAEELFLTAVSEAELLYGVTILPPGRRRQTLETAMTRWLDRGFAGRILPFDSAAATHSLTDASSTPFHNTSCVNQMKKRTISSIVDVRI